MGIEFNAGTLFINNEKLETITKMTAEDEKYEVGKKYLTNLNRSSAELEINFDADETNIQVLDKLGINTSRFPDMYTIQIPVWVQVRRHKKRRINKKWAKRYGYKMVMTESKGWKINSYTDGSFEFIKEYE